MTGSAPVARGGLDNENGQQFTGIESALEFGGPRDSLTVWLPSQQEVLGLRSDRPYACIRMSRSAEIISARKRFLTANSEKTKL